MYHVVENISIGLGLFFVLQVARPKKFEIKGLFGIGVFALGLYGLGALVTLLLKR